MSFAEKFTPDMISCNEVYNAGSAIYVGDLVNCSDEPVVYTVKPTIAIAQGDDTASLQVTLPSTGRVYLRKGAWLHFGANHIIVAEDTLVTATATIVEIEPAAAAIAITDTATTWGLQRILSPTNIPLQSDSTMVSRTDLSNGLQGSEVKTGTKLTSSVATITNPDDRAFWATVFPASQGTQSIFALIVRSGGRHAFGRAQVGTTSDDGNIEEISRISFDLSFQAPYANLGVYQHLSTVEQTNLNSVRKLAGLPALV